MRYPRAAALSLMVGLAGSATGLLAGTASGQQDAGFDQASAYAGDRVLRVVPESGERLARVLELSRHIWSERVGRGPIDVQVSSDAFDTLAKEGFEFEVLVEDVQASVDRQRADIESRAQLALNRGGDVIDFRSYYPLADLLAFVNQLAGERPDMVSVQTVGQSVQGRDIVTMTITAPGDASARPQVALNSLIHAREWITAGATLYTARRLVRDYGTDPRVTNLLDRVQFVITPVVNPDGYNYAWTNDRFWRKNRRNNGNGTFGVDLNRNFDINFGGGGADPFTNSEIYHGPSAFSEPESAAMRDLLQTLPDLRAHVDTHSYSQLILYAPGNVGQDVPDFDRLAEVGQEMQMAMSAMQGGFYTPQRGLDLYAAAGTFADWSYDEFRQLSYTFELRPEGGAGTQGFDPPTFDILPTAEEISEAYFHLAETAATPLRFRLLPPRELTTGVAKTLVFSVLPGEKAPSSVVRVFGRNAGGTYTQLGVQDLGNDQFAVDLQSSDCGSSYEFYVEALTDQADTIHYPAQGGATPIVVPVNNDAITFADSFNSDQGWSVTSAGGLTDGQWERDVPKVVATRGEPVHDAERTGWCYLTDNVVGNADVDGGQTILTSPVMDATGGESATLSFAGWLDNSRGSGAQQDPMTVQFSSNGGGSWTTALVIGPSGVEAAGGWNDYAIDIASVVPRTSNFRVRFIAEDTGTGSVVEAGVDAVEMRISQVCPAPSCPADVNGDGELTPSDFTAWIAAFNAQADGCDQNGNGTCEPSDFTAWIAAYNTGC